MKNKQNYKNAIILCSGGLDSVVTAFYVKKKLGYNKIIFMFFNYGQRTLVQERKASRYFSKKLKAEFKEIKLESLSKISCSLLNSDLKAKKVRRSELKDTKKESMKWYVPNRNSIFLNHAIALGESLWIRNKENYDIFVGFKCEGCESYPDTTSEFVNDINRMIKRTSCFPGKVIAPLIKKDKEDIIILGIKLGVCLEKTFSCYTGTKGDNHCGTCLSCMLRKEGFYWANIVDKTEYSR